VTICFNNREYRLVIGVRKKKTIQYLANKAVMTFEEEFLSKKKKNSTDYTVKTVKIDEYHILKD